MVAMGIDAAFAGNMKSFDKMMAKIDPAAPGSGLEGQMRNQFAELSAMIRKANAAAST